MEVQKDTETKRIRKKVALDPSICPVCSVTIRENELQNHFNMHIQKFTNKTPPSTPPSTSKATGSSSKDESNAETWSTFQKIKENRMRRTTRVS